MTASTMLKVLSTTAFKPLFDEQLPDLEKSFGCEVAVTYMPSARIVPHLNSGATADVVIATAEIISLLVETGKVLPCSQIRIARSEIGLAVAPGIPRPDISTVQGFKQAMLSAKSIMTSNPVGGGQSGRHLAAIFERLGIADAIGPKLRYGAGGPSNLVGSYLLRGEAEFGLQQMSELLAVPGIEIVGPLPEEIQVETVFSAGLSVAATDSVERKGLMDFLTSSKCMAFLKMKGMQPP